MKAHDLGRLITAPIRRRRKFKLQQANDMPSYVHAFRRLNAVDMHWPIDVEAIDGIIRLRDEANFELFVARKERFSLYRNGVQERLRRLEKEYLLHRIPIGQDDVIVDVGANIGEVSVHLARSLGCRVIAVEPEEAEFNCLVRNLRSYNAVCINRPLWSSETELLFYSKNGTGDSSLFETKGFDEQKLVRTTKLDTVLDESGADRIKLLKLEAEGAEPEILDGATRWLHRIDFIAADVGPERGLKSESTAIPVIDRLIAHGFELLHIGSPRLVCLFSRRGAPRY